MDELEGEVQGAAAHLATARPVGVRTRLRPPAARRMWLAAAPARVWRRGG